MNCYHLFLGFVVSWRLFARTLRNLFGEGANLVLKTAIHHTSKPWFSFVSPKILNNFKTRFLQWKKKKWHFGVKDFDCVCIISWKRGGEDDRGFNILWIPVVCFNYTRPSSWMGEEILGDAAVGSGWHSDGEPWRSWLYCFELKGLIWTMSQSDIQTINRTSSVMPMAVWEAKHGLAVVLVVSRYVYGRTDLDRGWC